MAVTTNHSDNLPRKFRICPHCRKKGEYENHYVRFIEIRCKYCKNTVYQDR